MQTMVGRVSQKGQIVIPASIRKKLNLTKGSEVTFEVQDDKIMIKKLPSALVGPILSVKFQKNALILTKMAIMILRSHQSFTTGWLMANASLNLFRKIRRNSQKDIR